MLFRSTSLTVQNLFEVPQNKSMELIGTDNGTLILGDKLTLYGILKFSAPDTLSNGTLVLNGGTLTVNENSNITSDITHIDDSSINVNSGKTLSYTGSAPEIGALTLTMSGGGTFDNTNDFTLNDPVSVLALNGIAVSRVSVTAELTTGKLGVNNDSIVKTFSHPASSRLNISAGVRLTVEDSFEIPENTSLNLVGAGNGRSEERRVGKECRSRWSPYPSKKKKKT